MSLRVLLGGVASSFSKTSLRLELAASTCIPFGPGTILGPAENWEALCARLPGGWPTSKP